MTEIAEDSLKNILIALQSSLLKHLYPAAGNDDLIDFSLLVDISDIGRIKAVSALYELHMRMAVAAPIARSVRPTALLQNSSVKPQPILDALRNVPISPFNEGLPIHMLPQNPDYVAIGSSQVNNELSSTSPRPRSFNKLKSFLRRGSSHASQLPSPPSSPQDEAPISPPLQLYSSKSTVVSPFINDATPSDHGISSNPWEESSHFQADEAGKRTSFSSRLASVTTMTLPSPGNDYGGFCKGAYYLQAGLNGDGVKLRNNSIAKTGESWYWGCQNQNCVFEGRCCKIRKDFFFDDSVWEFKSDGIPLIRYRWAFLAKSHVAIKKSRERIYNYRCIFCVLQGLPAPIITKKGRFLEHVAEHQNQRLDESMLRRTLCISGRVATDDEYFDINFLPTTPVYEDENGVDPEDHEPKSPAIEDQKSTGGFGLYENAILDDDPWRNP